VEHQQRQAAEERQQREAVLAATEAAWGRVRMHWRRRPTRWRCNLRRKWRRRRRTTTTTTSFVGSSSEVNSLANVMSNNKSVTSWGDLADLFDGVSSNNKSETLSDPALQDASLLDVINHELCSNIDSEIREVNMYPDVSDSEDPKVSRKAKASSNPKATPSTTGLAVHVEKAKCEF
jgi:hypothetical protein